MESVFLLGWIERYQVFLGRVLLRNQLPCNTKVVSRLFVGFEFCGRGRVPVSCQAHPSSVALPHSWVSSKDAGNVGGR